MSYTFDVRLTRNNGQSVLGIDTLALYGYWERRDGSEGGGLWFARSPGGQLELIDYDGETELPQEWVRALRDAGYLLDETFD